MLTMLQHGEVCFALSTCVSIRKSVVTFRMLRARVVREYIRGNFAFWDRSIWTAMMSSLFFCFCLCLIFLFRELFIDRAHLRSPKRGRIFTTDWSLAETGITKPCEWFHNPQFGRIGRSLGSYTATSRSEGQTTTFEVLIVWFR